MSHSFSRTEDEYFHKGFNITVPLIRFTYEDKHNGGASFYSATEHKVVVLKIEFTAPYFEYGYKNLRPSYWTIEGGWKTPKGGWYTQTFSSRVKAEKKISSLCSDDVRYEIRNVENAEYKARMIKENTRKITERPTGPVTGPLKTWVARVCDEIREEQGGGLGAQLDAMSKEHAEKGCLLEESTKEIERSLTEF